MALVIAHAELVSDQTSDPRTAPQRRREAVRLGAFQQQRLEAFELRGVQQRLTAGAAGLAQPGFAVTPVSSQPLADALPRDLQSPRCLGLTTALLDQPDRFETALLQGLEIPPYAFCISHTYKDVRTPKRCHFILRDSIGEQDRIQERFGETLIREGDIVIDCGAHVGTFVHHALANGASKVVAIDPDPTQVECLRRNFREEIAAGRVVVVPEGVWNEQGTMTLYVVSLHSGASSLLEKPGEKEITVKVTTIDELVGRLELPRVDLIKLDIEGAEREALRGASETLEKYGPALLIDSYHRPDDAEVLPRLIDAAGVGYQASCGWCGLEKGRSKHLKPHVQLYRSAPR